MNTDRSVDQTPNNTQHTLAVRILILEDQPDGIALLTAAIQGCFDEPDVSLAINLAGVRELVATQTTDFNYALIDLRLPDGLSIEWLTQFKLKFPQTRVIVTSLYDDDDFVYAALRAGADGYVLKGDGLNYMQQALRKIVTGEPPISPAIARKIIRLFRDKPDFTRTTASASASSTAAHLTTRETEVLGLIGKGLMIKQVAVQLGIGYHTVNDNIKSIYRKLGIRTRAQAAGEATRRGLISG